ncbi:Rieske 2Fe-2S domain-containing protein [Streptomyces sp. NBC_00631]|uniref:Rieske 2Fe-2S domain-containing protein n=1 Tax=Streptomyces sp. NBC_00631 TaxID=2975793 RepID=UPI0030DEF7EA
MTENNIATGYPNTWYGVELGKKLRRGQVLNTVVAGRKILLYRTADGQARAVDPVCPHLGANIGVGGFVDGADIVCPFHHFAYAPDGSCVRTGVGTRPPKARLTTHPTSESGGLIYVWIHSNDEDPGWTVPACDVSGYPAGHAWTKNLQGHSLDAIENAHDYTHFQFVHHTPPPETFGPPKIEGHMVTTHFQVAGFWFKTEKAKVDLTITFHGPNVFVAHLEVPGINFHAIEVAAYTPRQERDATFMKMAYANIGLPEGVPTAISRSLNKALTILTGRSSGRQVINDAPIWGNRTFLLHQHTTDGEQHIPLIRRWANQFYTNLS